MLEFFRDRIRMFRLANRLHPKFLFNLIQSLFHLRASVTLWLQCSDANYLASVLLLQVVDFVFLQSQGHIGICCSAGLHTPSCDALVVSGCLAATLLPLSGSTAEQKKHTDLCTLNHEVGHCQ